MGPTCLIPSSFSLPSWPAATCQLRRQRHRFLASEKLRMSTLRCFSISWFNFGEASAHCDTSAVVACSFSWTTGDVTPGLLDHRGGGRGERRAPQRRNRIGSEHHWYEPFHQPQHTPGGGRCSPLAGYPRHRKITRTTTSCIYLAGPPPRCVGDAATAQLLFTGRWPSRWPSSRRVDDVAAAHAQLARSSVERLQRASGRWKGGSSCRTPSPQHWPPSVTATCLRHMLQVEEKERRGGQEERERGGEIVADMWGLCGSHI
uniref:Uncharacterized protein n=1 Tax=Oryza sativa subsp. japonica TaxID=39947 RepID=Q6ZAB4_ORYSJ|nr:hypothetical protein [Oryza sativa Japonica Group]BAD09808.1 hypothetical protein [Oryza sativa Japonica Group]